MTRVQHFLNDTGGLVSPYQMELTGTCAAVLDTGYILVSPVIGPAEIVIEVHDLTGMEQDFDPAQAPFFGPEGVARSH